MRYSIIAACHKFTKLTERFLDSIHKYPVPDSELILIDNTNKPAFTEILKKYPAIILSKGVNIGTSMAWNMGMKEAKGKYFIILCSNCVVTGKDWWIPYEKEINKYTILSICEHFMGITFIDRRMIDEAHIWYDENIFYGGPDVDLLNQINLKRKANRFYGRPQYFRYKYIDLETVKMKHLHHKSSAPPNFRERSIQYGQSKPLNVFGESESMVIGKCKKCKYEGFEGDRGCPVCKDFNNWRYIDEKTYI